MHVITVNLGDGEANVLHEQPMTTGSVCPREVLQHQAKAQQGNITVVTLTVT